MEFSPDPLPTLLFVYGTLRHDQPEHAQHCHGVRGWRRARVRGNLVRTSGGYPLLVVDAAALLARATEDAHADERVRQILPSGAVEHTLHGSRDPWAEGELLDLADAAKAWPPLDAWEDFAPGSPGVYQRALIAVEALTTTAAPALLAAWAYIATEIPPDAKVEDRDSAVE